MAMDRRERTIEISKMILDLRSRLHALETELDALIAEPKNAPRVASESKVATPPSGETIADRIIGVLERERGKDFDTTEMLWSLRMDVSHTPTVRSTLHRLTGEKRIARSSPGRFAALPKDQAGITQPEGETTSHHGVKDAAA
jgi:hypothetical protein